MASTHIAKTSTNMSEVSTVAPSEFQPEHMSQSTQVHSSETTKQHATLQIDFKWGKFTSRISDTQNTEVPLYLVKYKILSQKQLIYLSGATQDVIGTGSIHIINIDADYECHGRRDTLVAQKRLSTLYTHRSGVLKNHDNTPAVLTWTGDIGLTKWNFVCVDEQQMPVAKFSANLWGLRKIGKIYLMGQAAYDEGLRDEMVITGMTLAYCMITRMNNIFSLVGAIFGEPGHDKKYKSDPVSGKVSKTAESSSESISRVPTATPSIDTTKGSAAQSDVLRKS
ncbi:hypothetical protein N7488_000486 [Penicillium malachiteum]|nr:hypothetical protein N7488_000486 [Penicillium malachiteum]